jgi:hypothetical protein
MKWKRFTRRRVWKWFRTSGIRKGLAFGLPLAVFQRLRGDNVKISLKYAVTILTATLICSEASAHHSAAQFDFGNTVLVEGTVVRARFANPHLRLILEVTDEKGTREIEFEGHSRNNMLRQGLEPEMFGSGDTVTIRIAPMRNGQDGGYVTALRTPDGQEIGRVTAPD